MSRKEKTVEIVLSNFNFPVEHLRNIVYILTALILFIITICIINNK